MAKVILNKMAKPDSPIYKQPIGIGARFTGSGTAINNSDKKPLKTAIKKVKSK